MAHTGSCHCGQVKFTADVDLTQPVLECNCSHCSRKGFLLAFGPRDALTVTEGEDSMTEYLFNTHKIRHQFCPTCGVEPFAWGKGPKGEPTAAINVRCLDGVDLGALKRQPYDGKDM